MSTYMKPGQAWLYDSDTNDIVGVKDRDGGETFFGRQSTDPNNNTVLIVDNETIRPSAKTGANFVLVGDSITAQANQTVTVTAMTRASNVVTATATAHGLLSGQKVKICNAMPDDFNGEYTVTRDTDANGGDNAFTFTSVGSDGAATLSGHPSSGTFEVRVMERYTSRGWWPWLESAFSGGVRLAKNAAVGGWTSHYAASAAGLAFLDDQIGDEVPTDICIAYGINDCVAGTAVADQITDLTTLCEWGKAKGARVWLETIKPAESGYANSTNINELVAKVNRELRNYARDTDGVYLVDTYSAVVNPATGHCTAGLTSDNIHPNEGCARVKLGPTWYAAMNGIVKPANYLAMGVFDNYGADTASKVLWDTGPWAVTTGGTATGGVTGDISATLTVEESGDVANATVCAFGAGTARSDGFGYDQECKQTAAAANDLTQVTLTTPTLARFVGQRVRVLVPFTITGNTAGNIKGLYAHIRQTVGSNTGFSYSGSNATSNALWGVSDDTITGVMCTPPMLIDAAASAIQINVGRMTAAGAGTCTFKVGRITVIKE